MSRKKVNLKLTVASLTLGIIFLASIISIVLVLAANRQNITSNISVSFVSNNVSATVDGTYWVAGSSEKLPLGNPLGGGR